MTAEAEVMVVGASLWSDGARLPGVDAVAMRAGRVQAIGRAADLAPLAGRATRRIDARGATVTPGMTDSHIHLVAWARSLDQVDLSGSASREAALARVAAFAAERSGEDAIVGIGWEFDAWREAPDRASLDAVCPDRPVLLYSKDTHNLWVNGEALRRAGIDRGTADPDGGWIDRDAEGEPTGILREHAASLCRDLQQRTFESDLDAVRRAAARLHAEGVTAVHDFEAAEAFRVLRAFTNEAPPRLRVLMHLAHAGLDHARAIGLESGVGDDRFRVGAVKLFADGTLGSRTAALLEPYDDSTESGRDLIEPAALAGLIRRALEAGLSLTIHAIGDRAVRSSLDGFAAARELIPAVALPPRIEHVQLLDPADVPRFAELGVAASMQPVHCTSDIDLVRRHWSTRLPRAYPWQRLLDGGAMMAFGSDAPVEAPSVAAGLHAAVTRSRAGEDRPFVPEQRIGLDQALAAYTQIPARLSGGWPRLGTIRPGGLADLVVWNEDLHAADPRELHRAHPVATLIEGEIVHDAEPSGTSALGGGRPTTVTGAMTR